MKIKLYNTLSRNLEVFRPENPQKLRFILVVQQFTALRILVIFPPMFIGIYYLGF